MSTKEEKLEKFVLDKPEEELKQIRGHPEKVLALIDEFATTQDWLMNIGPIKGKFILDKIKERDPLLMIELGGYMGYSAILFASSMPHPTAKYYSFELSADFASIARKFIDLAGLSNKVSIVVGDARENLIQFAEQLKSGNDAYTSLDFVFIDHAGERYTDDFRLLESLNLIAPKSVIMADNISIKKLTDYCKYVQGSPEDRHKYNLAHPDEKGNPSLGRWNLIYSSKTNEFKNKKGEVWDGVEHTVCTDYLSG